jgi:hypothetical protein
MKASGFEIHAEPFISNATCRVCRKRLHQVSNGLFGVAMFCPACESVYELKLVKIPGSNVGKEFIEQSHNEVNAKNMDS